MHCNEQKKEQEPIEAMTEQMERASLSGQ